MPLPKDFNFDAEYQVTDGEEAAPVSIDAVDQPPVNYRPDYIPPDGKQLPWSTPDPPPKPPIIMERNSEYVSHEETVKREAARRQRIKELAIKFYRDAIPDIQRYERSVEFIGRVTDKQKSDPSPELRRAMATVDRGMPMTKEQAIGLAKKKVEAEARVQQ